MLGWVEADQLLYPHLERRRRRRRRREAAS